jgi:methylmalonyl-CoA/ethylmalonyl-CoA epimerase
MQFKLEHIGLVVESIDDFKKIVKVFRPQMMTAPLADPVQKVAASFVTIGEGQNVYVELLEPADEASPVTKFLRKRGGGLHHLCFEVDDIDEATKMLQEEGFKMVVAPVDCPTYDKNLDRQCPGVTRIAFFMLTDYFLVELLQKG